MLFFYAFVIIFSLHVLFILKTKAVKGSVMGIMRGKMEFSLRIHLLLFPDVLLIIRIINKGTVRNSKSNNKHVEWELIDAVWTELPHPGSQWDLIEFHYSERQKSFMKGFGSYLSVLHYAAIGFSLRKNDGTWLVHKIGPSHVPFNAPFVTDYGIHILTER